MVSEITLPYNIFSSIANTTFCGVKTVSISLGCADFAKRDIPNNAGPFPVCLRLITDDGTYVGNGAYVGVVDGFHLDLIEALWKASGETLDENELYIQAMDCNEGDYLEQGSPICLDCLKEGGGEVDSASLNPVKNQVCESCRDMVDDRIFFDLQVQ